MTNLPVPVIVPIVVALLVVAVVGVVGRVLLRQRRGRARAVQLWREYRAPELPDFGSTRSLTILPLVDWHTSRPELRGEAGVSYLVTTDSASILFDTGFNPGKLDPSPLLSNMSALGVELSNIDTIVISHCHADHVGGMGWAKQRTFSLGNTQLELGGKRVFTPIEMSYPGIEPLHSPEPTVIAAGVATTGTIARQLFLGWVEEQALAVNVEGIGVVLIVGCGHQTMPKLLERSGQVFRAPLFGLVGGLHYPIPRGRMKFLGLDVQRLLASGDGPFHPASHEDVRADIDLLLQRSPGLVALSGHDSSDQVIEEFQRTFGSAYRHIRVGEPILVGN